MLRNCINKIGIVLLLAGAAAAGGPDESTLVYPPFRHDFGLHHVSDFHLRLYTGNRDRFLAPKGIAAVKLIERDRPDKTGDDDELTVFGLNSAAHQLIYNDSQTSIRVYGGKGSGEGEFLFPWAIAASPSGDVYVADTGNDRIVHLRYRGGDLFFLRSFEEAKGDTARFRSPRGVALATDGTIYLCDTGNQRVLAIDRTGRLLRVLGGAEIFSHPEAIAVVDSGDPWTWRKEDFLIVVDRNGKRIRKLSPDGTILAETDAETLGSPTSLFRGVAVDHYHQVWLTDEANHRLVKLDRSLRFLAFFGREGGGDGEFRSPFGITIWRRYGQVFVSERSGAQYYWIGADLLDPRVEKGADSPGARFFFRLTERARLTVTIEDRRGRSVRVLAEERLFPPGERRLIWDGLNDSGEPAPPGAYRARFEIRATYSSSKHFQKKVAIPFDVG
ncbi:MAG: hypothetical protein JW958_05935 [Candidatus Eisenbacteria bacterium]|nr:hypothetical protein [Candidatus Eisenbacteria bacterium]